ncbi:hypothetical protein [Burkholderia sp. Ac-20365]|uniref:hypothetical protein n=1 Tax=Burkholderia sp. Ac-20365 TaxID=2703897 RepID=UPI00197BAF4B|nr:hypothetical protein [Burkholderia sp. Ac-20365]MBN3759876.1 hypothetical protein [Burkholderia sp. Ac-20365]
MFAEVVALYRALARPEVDENGRYVFVGAVDAEMQRLVDASNQLDAAYGEVDYFRQGDGQLRIEVSLPQGSNGHFYNTFSAFFRTPSIAFGVLPTDFYIADLDYYSGDTTKPTKLEEVEKLVDFIRMLSEFAEDRLTFGSGANRLLFVLPSDGSKPQRTLVLEVSPEEAALDNTLAHLHLLELLVDGSNAKKMHVEERRLVMKSAISDVLASAGADTNRLTHLCKEWREVLLKYRHNFQSYINKFAFDEIRKKIADSEIEYASKLSGVFGDIGGKLLALPLSLVALIALDDAKTTSAFFIGCLGLAIVSVVYFIILRNLWLAADRLKASFELAFSPFFNKLETYPSVLRNVLETRKKALHTQLRFLKLTFAVFYVLACLPAAGATLKVLARYWSEIVALSVHFNTWADSMYAVIA